MLGENPGLGGPDASFFPFHKEARLGPSPSRSGFGHAGGERRPFRLGPPLSGSLPARASRGEREPGYDGQIVIGLIAAHRSAELYSAVSQSFILPDVGE